MLRIEQVGDLVTRQVEREASPEHRKNKLEISEPELHFQPLHNAEAVACSAHLIEAALRRPTAFKRLTPSIAFHCPPLRCTGVQASRQTCRHNSEVQRLRRTSLKIASGAQSVGEQALGRNE